MGGGGIYYYIILLHYCKKTETQALLYLNVLSHQSMTEGLSTTKKYCIKEFFAHVFVMYISLYSTVPIQT